MKKYLSFEDFKSCEELEEFKASVCSKLLVSLPTLVYEHGRSHRSIAVRGIVNDALAYYNNFDCQNNYFDPFYLSCVFRYIDEPIYRGSKPVDKNWLKWCNEVLAL